MFFEGLRLEEGVNVMVCFREFIATGLCALTFASCASGPQPAGQGGAFAPPVSAEFTPPQLKGLVVGQSTDGDVLKLFPAAVRRAGTYNSSAAEVLVFDESRPGMDVNKPLGSPLVQRREFWVLPEADGLKRLVGFQVTNLHPTDRELCGWVEERFAGNPEALQCGPRRKQGKFASGKNYEYCIGTPDRSRGILVHCNVSSRGVNVYETLSYFTLDEGLGYSAVHQ